MRARGLVVALLAPASRACQEDSTNLWSRRSAPSSRWWRGTNHGYVGPFVGTIQPRYKTDLGFRVFGRMVARFVDVGSAVTKGRKSRPRSRGAGVAFAAPRRRGQRRAQFANAQAEEARQKDLVQRNITPQAQYDLALRNLETTQAT